MFFYITVCLCACAGIYVYMWLWMPEVKFRSLSQSSHNNKAL